MTASLSSTACCDGDVASLALQLSANDETKAFSTLSGFPTLSAAAGMRSKHGDLFAYVRSSRAAVPYDAPRSSLLGAAQAGPGGLPRVTTALNRLGVKKAKPQRRPSLPPEPLPPPPVDAVAVAPALVQPPPPPDACDLLTAELDALL